MKKITILFSLFIATMMVMPVKAQDDVLQQQLPIDKEVRYGVLPNGLTYYVRHNEEPKNRAEFHIAQKVGSILEEENQRGLAHFLEHMAFNGLEHYPGKSMLEYFQSIGLTFGGDINAYTGFDETVYRLSNVPTDRVEVLDSALLVLHDWACAITLDPAEIDAERGVIHEEWRTGADATQRLYESVLPIIFHDSKYANRLPIGTMDVVMNFKPQEIRDYYHRWYRPDQQGIIVIGDFDAEKMEQKIIDMFSTIKMPENPAKREYFPVPDHKGIDYAIHTDPESSNALAYIFFQHPTTPTDERSTIGYVRKELISDLACSMLNNRFSEIAQTPEAPFMYAGSFDDNFFIAKTKDAYTLIGVAKDGMLNETFESVLTEAQRINLHGFTATELVRAVAELSTSLENLYNERNKHKNLAYAEEYIDHFTDGGYIPGIEIECQLKMALLPTITVEEVSEYAKNAISDDNVSIILNAPKKEGVVYPSKEDIEQLFAGIFSQDVEAYVDNVNNEPLIAEEPTAGKIISETKDEATGITTMTLSNGAKVQLKPTDFKNDEILMSAESIGGYWAYKNQYSPELHMVDLAVESSALGSYTRSNLEKYMAGKKASLSFSLTNDREKFSGTSVKKDLETLLQLNYLYFTDVRPDEKAFEASRSTYISHISMAKNNPDVAFRDSVKSTISHHNRLEMNPTVEALKALDYGKSLDIYRQRVSNAGDFVFSFVGSFDVDSIRPLIEKYIASLPDNGAREKTKFIPKGINGKIENKFELPMENPKMSIRCQVEGNMKFSLKNKVMTELLSEVMDIVYTRTIREEEGGTYGVGTYAYLSFIKKQYAFLLQFDTNMEAGERLINRALKELKNVVENGADAADFQKVKEAAIKDYETQLCENHYWMSVLSYRTLGVDSFTGMLDILNNLTLEDFNQFLKKNVKLNNQAIIVMNGISKE